MALIIDGYNLLYVTGIVGDVAGAGGTFQRSREALLNFLATSIPETERGQTTIVFDAAEAPTGLPRTINHKGMTVRYASDYVDADALIEQLIGENHVPRSLLVVSSDHRIQRAARRRRAAFIDSDRWYSELWQRRLASQQVAQLDKPVTQLTAAEIEYWVEKFGSGDEISNTPSVDEQTDATPSKRVAKKRKKDPPPRDIRNPFPPGYGEDLLGK
jgi:uncharacterized protein